MSKLDIFLQENNDVWKTQSSFMSWLRGGCRRSLWNNSPQKTKFIKNNRKQINNPNPKGKKETVWGGTCGICKNDFVLSNLQVDHINDNVSSLKELSDIRNFIEDIVIVLQNELRFCCKQCHEIQTYSQKHQCSFIEAEVYKKHILYVKESVVVKELKLRGIDVPPKTKKAQNALLLQMMLEEI